MLLPLYLPIHFEDEAANAGDPLPALLPPMVAPPVASCEQLGGATDISIFAFRAIERLSSLTFENCGNTNFKNTNYCSVYEQFGQRRVPWSQRWEARG
jgi:hypothetical protein